MTGDIDKVLEAEQTIATLVHELGRMKAAADLLSGAQEKTDALLTASDEVIRVAGTFADEGKGIIRQLRTMDLDARLADMSQQTSESQAFLNLQLNQLSETLDQLQQRNADLLEALDQIRKEIPGVVHEIGAQLAGHTKQAHADLKKALHTVYQNQQFALEQIRRAQDEQQEQLIQAHTSQLEQLHHAQTRQQKQMRRDRLPLLVLTGANLILLIVLVYLLYLR